MRKSRRADSQNPRTRENQLINMAFKLAEEKLKDGTASSQLITHFLKLATVREELENERLRSDLRVADAKIKHLESQETASELYENALKAFATYSGEVYEETEEDDEED